MRITAEIVEVIIHKHICYYDTDIIQLTHNKHVKKIKNSTERHMEGIPIEFVNPQAQKFI